MISTLLCILIPLKELDTDQTIEEGRGKWFVLIPK